MNIPYNKKPILFKKRTGLAKMLVLGVIPAILLTSPRWPEHTFPHEIMELLGHVLVMVGILIRVGSSLYVGGRKNDALVTSGPFSVVRNPLYVGSFIAIAGLGMLTGSMIITTGILTGFMVLHGYTVKKEEQFLTEKFGAEYSHYMNQVPRWIPNFYLWKSDQEIAVKPAFVLRTMRDGLTFISILLLLEICCTLRGLGHMPSFITLP